MIKFFRKIRQKLIIENNTGKYLQYAIGEIFLVVIGILIALQINNWNENKIKRTSEIMYYINVRNRLIDDKNLIQGSINYNNRHYTQFKYANEIVEVNDRTKTDTLEKIARNLPNYSDFDGQDNIYETMVNSGQIKLLQNHKIIEGIRELEERYLSE